MDKDNKQKHEKKSTKKEDKSKTSSHSKLFHNKIIKL